MQLEISNVAKIKEAKINIDGITVIAGENNTGKSTIGKLLFAIYSSMNNMEEKIEQEKYNEIYETVISLLQYCLSINGMSLTYRKKYMTLARKCSENIIKYSKNKNFDGDIETNIKEYVMESGVPEEEIEKEFITECISKIETILNVSDKKIMTEVITRWFDRIFENQMSPLREEDIKSEINLIIRNKKVEYTFKENACIDWNYEFNILHQAFYIDNPFALDYMSDRMADNRKSTETHLVSSLCKKEEHIFEGIFDTVIAKDKLNNIYNMLDKLIGGEIIAAQDGQFCLKSSQFNKPLNVKNLSTGLKSFAIIKRLLENGSLKEKDVLILDEPEIHLHPEWQLAYAELIILLQKEFDLTMLITTHSPYFLDAIDIFSAKHEISNRINYYLAENKGEESYLQDVTHNIDAIYKKLSEPLQRLENIRSSLR